MTRIAVHLALGVAAEVVTVEPEAMAVRQSPSACEHSLGFQSRWWRPGTDLVGHNPLEIALEGDLLQQGPGSVGIRLKTEGTTHDPPLPAQPIRSLEQQGPRLQTIARRRLNRGGHHRGDGLRRGAVTDVGQWRCIGRKPHLPGIGMGHLRPRTFGTPTLRHPLSRLKAGERPRHKTGDGQRFRQGAPPPADQQRGGTDQLRRAIAVPGLAESQRGRACAGQLQGYRRCIGLRTPTEMVREGHPESLGGRRRGRRHAAMRRNHRSRLHQ